MVSSGTGREDLKQRGSRVSRKKAKKPRGSNQLQNPAEYDWQCSTHWTHGHGLTPSQFIATRSKTMIPHEELLSLLPRDAYIPSEHPVDEIEQQIRSEYRELALTSNEVFQYKFTIQPATKAPVIMLESGYSVPKTYKIFTTLVDISHLVPFRLFKDGERKFVEARLLCKWMTLPALLDTLHPEKHRPTYERLHEYWQHLQIDKKLTFRFLELPLELRRLVYQRVVLDDGFYITFFSAKGLIPPTIEPLLAIKDPNCHSGLLKVSSQVRMEALAEFYTKGRFFFEDHSELINFLRCSPPENATHVRHIELRFAPCRYFWLFHLLKSSYEGTTMIKLSNLRCLLLILTPECSDCFLWTESECPIHERKFKDQASVSEQILQEFREMTAPLEDCQPRIVEIGELGRKSCRCAW